MVIYAPLSVRERLAAHRNRTRKTATEILLDAFDETHDQLPAMYQAGAPPQQRQSLFERTAARRRADTDDPLVQIFVSMTARNLVILDHITATVAPGNNRARSRVAALALDAHLPPIPVTDHRH